MKLDSCQWKYEVAYTIRYDRREFKVDSKAEYSA